MKKQLKELGFKENEAKIYLYLARNPSSLASKISKKVGMYRPYVYDTLQRLIEKGYVSYVIKSGKRYFSASPPEKIVVELEMQKEQIEKKKRLAEKLIPGLNDYFVSPSDEYLVDVFEGKEGLKTHYEWLFRLAGEGKVNEVLSFGGRGDVFKTLEYYYPNLIGRAVKKGFFRKTRYSLIWGYSKRGSKEHKRLDKHIKIRFLPKEVSFPSGVIIFLDYLIIAKMDNPPFLVRIKNKELSDSFRQLFKSLWRMSKR